MARVSRFSENFEHVRFDSTSNMADAHIPAQKPPQKPCQTFNAGKTMKLLMMKPFHGLCAITNTYKQHLNIMLNTNLRTSSSSSSTKKQSKGHDVVEAGSTAYGLPPASEEELRRERERNHVDYVFGLGPDTCTINNTTAAITAINTNTNINTKKATTMPDLEFRTFDVRACWNQAYTSDTSSEIENINNAHNDYFNSTGYNPTTFWEDAF